jgi:hypothetical protein
MRLVRACLHLMPDLDRLKEMTALEVGNHLMSVLDHSL